MGFFTRLLFTMLGMAFAMLFAAGVLCWLVLYVAFACVRWLVTGKKPQVLLMWQQIQAMRKGMLPGQSRGWSGPLDTVNKTRHENQVCPQRSNTKTDMVEDVVVREIHDKRHIPKD